MKNLKKTFSTNKLKWIAILLLLAVGAYAAIGFWGVPALVQSTILPKLSQSTGMTLSAKKVRVNPFYLTLELQDLSIFHDGRQLASAADLALNVSSRSIFTLKPVLQSVVLDTPDVQFVREKSGALNWPAAKPAPKEETPEKEAAEKKPLQFWIDQVSIKNGLFAFDDTTADFIHQIQDLNVTVDDLGLDEEKPTQIHLSGHYNEAPVTIQGAMRLFDPAPEANLNIQIESLALPTFLKYLREKPAANLSDGFLHANLDVGFDAEKPLADRLFIKGNITLEKIAITDRQTQAMVTVPKAVAKISEAYPLGNRWQLERVAVEAPYLRFERPADGDVNMADLSPLLTKPNQSEAPSNNPVSSSKTTKANPQLDLLIKSIVLEGGQVDFLDATWAQPFEKHLTDVDLHLTDFTLNKKALAKTELSFNTQAGESATFEGDLGLVPFLLDGNITLSKVVLADYLPFYHSKVGFDYKDGRGDASGQIHFDTAKGPLNWALTGITLDLQNIVLVDRRSGQTVVNTKQLTAKQCDLIPSEKILRFGKLTSPGGSIELVREPSGNMNLASLFSSQSVETTVPEATPETSQPAEKNAAANSWQVRFEAVDLESQTVIFKDETVKPTVTLKMDPSTVTAQNLVIGRPEKSRIKFTSKIGPQSQVKLDGTLQINPFLLESTVTTKSLDLAQFQPYFPPSINIGLESGKLYTNSQLKMALPQGKPFNMTIGGDMVVKDFATVNTQTNQSLLDVKTLDVKSAQLDIAPFAFSSQQINLIDFVSSIIVAPDGLNNFINLLGKSISAKTSTPPSSTPTHKALPINIAKITLQKGRIAFSDQFTKPNFEAQIDQIEGHITNMNSTSPADIKMTGIWEDQQPVQIEGTLNPFTKYPQTVLRFSVKGLSMSHLSPYSGKYLGRDISRGNLSLDLKYKVDGSQLAGENIATLEDLDLGETVDSPDAVVLPIELAVSLLKNLNNDIHLDLPVTGDLADPKFRLGGTILRVLGNLITKVITAPFAMIGSVFGGGESLGFIDFDPGKSTLAPSETEKLKTLADALEKKPTLRLDILGDADPDRDARALQQHALFEMIASVKKPVPETISAETILALDDYEKRIKKLFKKIVKSTPEKSSTEKPTPLQMEQSLLDQITITDSELRQLANQRARVVEGYFLTQNQLDPSRFFVLKPDIPPAKKGEPSPASQVRFTLR